MVSAGLGAAGNGAAQLFRCHHIGRKRSRTTYSSSGDSLARLPASNLLLDGAQPGAYGVGIAPAEFELRHVGMARAESALQHARKLIEIEAGAERSERRRARVRTFTDFADGVAARQIPRPKRPWRTGSCANAAEPVSAATEQASTQAALVPHFDGQALNGGAPEGIRTPDPQIRSLVLYPAELPAPATGRRRA